MPTLAMAVEMFATAFVGGLGGALLYKVCRRQTPELLRLLRRLRARPRSRLAAEDDPADVFRGIVMYKHAVGVEEGEVADEARDMMRGFGYEERYAEGGGSVWAPSAPNLSVSKHA